MKNNLRMLFIFVALGVISLARGTGFAQTDEPITGGYAPVNVIDAEIVSAAKFAVKAQAKKDKMKIKFVSVNKAAQQVVAGLNYKLCLSVDIVEKKKPVVPQIVEAIIFQDLKRKRTLTSWAVAACTDAAPIEPVK